MVHAEGDDDVGGDVRQTLKSCHQAHAEDGETPGVGDKSSGVEEVVNSDERKADATEVDLEGQEVSEAVGVGGRERVEDGARAFHEKHQNKGIHKHRQHGEGGGSVRHFQAEKTLDSLRQGCEN